MSEIDQKVEALYQEPAAEITTENTYIDAETGTIQFNDTAAIKLVLTDTETADNFININQWASGWTMADLLYQSPMSGNNMDGGGSAGVASSSVPKFMVSNHISSIVPKVMGGIFYEDPCFLLRPSPGTDQGLLDAKTAVFTFELKAMHFEEEIERGLDQMALLGTGIWKWGYTEYKKKIKKYKRYAEKTQVPDGEGVVHIDTPESDDFEVIFYDKTISHPWLRWCDIRTVLVDPGCRVGDIRRAAWVVYRDYATYQDLDRLRGVEGYEIPDEEVLRAIFARADKPSSGPDNISMTIPEGMMGYLQHSKPRNYKTTADPNRAPIEILERWDNEKVIVVLCFNGHNILIRNEANPYGRIPFLSANWRNIPDSFYGQGLGLLIGSEQIVEQGVTNLALDLLAYCLQPVALRKKGFNAPTQNTRWEQGGIIDVEEDVEKAFKFLQMPAPPSEAFQFIQQSQAAGAATSGANEQVIQGAGHAGVSTTGMRSGTGAAAVIQANASRLDGPTGRFVRQCFEPWLLIMDELNNDLLPTTVLREILGEKIGAEYKLDHIDYRNAKFEYEVLAGANLGAKKEMAQALPIMIQLLNNPTFVTNANDAGYQFDAVAIFQAFTDAAGWKFSQKFLRPMSDEERQRHQANSPAALQQAQAASAEKAQAAKFAQEQTLENQKQLGKAGNEAVRASIEKSMSPLLSGGPEQTQGFAATTAL
ncbi:Uncharacterised protein [uncultured archaeon]|nr:Uncharacterised protein [uncultured archaeon]